MRAEVLEALANSTLAAATEGKSAFGREVLINVTLATWAVGAFAMFFSMLARQRSFVRSLGVLTRDADGLYRSDIVVAPMLVGTWHSKIVVPTDFEARYSTDPARLRGSPRWKNSTQTCRHRRRR